MIYNFFHLMGVLYCEHIAKITGWQIINREFFKLGKEASYGKRRTFDGRESEKDSYLWTGQVP
jgi:hypothetical protein